MIKKVKKEAKDELLVINFTDFLNSERNVILYLSKFKEANKYLFLEIAGLKI